MGKRHKPEDIIGKVREAEIVLSQGGTIGRTGEDHYGRTLAVVSGSQGDLSCWQLKHKQVVYKADWDDGFADRSRLSPWCSNQHRDPLSSNASCRSMGRDGVESCRIRRMLRG